MADNKLDRKTAEIMAENERISRFVEGDDWKAVKKSLIQKIVLNDSVSTIIADVPADKLVIEIMARAQASAIVLEWLKEIEGRAKQAIADNLTLISAERTDQIELHFESPLQ